MVDKVLITNNSVLIKKYGGSGLQSIQGAIAKLIVADQGRSLQTICVAVDDQNAMQGVNGATVASPTDPAQNKAAVDAIYAFHTPQYLVILGAPDVIPHQDLSNPAYDPANPTEDPDQNVPSDLPYACNAPYSQSPADFIAPSRVVSRLPDVTGSTDPSYLLHIIDLACAASPLTHAEYTDYLGVSASVWNQSTALSLGAVFGSSTDMQSVPPASYQWPPPLLIRRSHFFNCHGASNSSQFYGQSGQNFPVAHDAAYISGKLSPGTVASVECCYGAQLYDPNGPAGGQMGIANVYLDCGGYGYWGSTTIAYGPADSNSDADLICQYFLQEILNGSSIGLAALSARLSFVKNTAAMSPVDLKTLAQFILLGDASVQCIAAPDPGTKAVAKFAFPQVSAAVMERASRIHRRQALGDEATMLSKTKAVSERTGRPSSSIQAKLDAILAAAGMPKVPVLSFRVVEKTEAKSFRPENAPQPAGFQPTAFHLLREIMAVEKSPVIHIRVVEVAESNGEVIRVKELFSR
jgi:hypothetical protein